MIAYTGVVAEGCEDPYLDRARVYACLAFVPGEMSEPALPCAACRRMLNVTIPSQRREDAARTLRAAHRAIVGVL